MIKLRKIALGIVSSVLLVTAVSAATATFPNGDTVTYTGTATATTSGNDLILTFTTSGTLTLSKNYSARLLAVGGGGSGETGYNLTNGRTQNTRWGSGGNGGSAVEDTRTLSAQTYTITVGSGGAAKSPSSTTARTAGENGKASTVTATGFTTFTAPGGNGGGTTGTPAAGSAGTKVTSDITGTSATYGGNGGAVGVYNASGAAGTANTGNGGGRNGSTSGAGGSGVVIVRLTQNEQHYEFNGKDIAFSGADATLDANGDLLLTFTGNGTLTLPSTMTLDVLAVGGGGGGGGSGWWTSNPPHYGKGGNGGTVTEVTGRSVSAQTLTITVGAGGAGGLGNVDGQDDGGSGGASSVTGTTGFTAVSAAGGAGGYGDYSTSTSAAGTGASGSGATGKTSTITGATYGAGGAGNTSTSTNPTAGAANTGNGGQAARAATSANTNRNGADGGSGIVVIRIKAAADPVCRIGDVTYLSLAAALEAAADNDTIVLLRNVVLNESLFFNKPVTLTSEEGETFTITRNASHADKTMAVGSSVVFENITFDGGSTTGARLINVAANGNLTLGNGTTIQHVYCNGAQAILLNDGSSVLNIEKGAVISDCKASNTTGGAIRVNSGTLNMTGGTITGCANTTGDGGAIYVNEGAAVVNVRGGTISNCSASGAGGAITANEGVVNIYGGVITGNTAGTNGGAVQYGPNGGILAGGTITGNTAGTTAGGVYVKGPVQVYGSPKVVDNTVGGAANNLVPTYATQIQLKGTLTGRIGVSYPATAAEGAQFGAFKAGTGANNFVYDGGTYAGEISNGTLVWSSSAKPGPMPEDDDPDKPVDPVDPMYYIGSPQARPVDLDEFQATGAEVKRVGNDVVLIYTNTAGGTLTIPSYAHARVMAVGGGAAGGTVGIGTEKGAGGGGGAGGMSEMTTTLMPGTYQIQVGAGAKRVDSYVQSWVGNNGGFSALVNPQGTYITSAKGGGGGGAPKDNGAGVDGGSGGGGSWWGVLTSGGSYTDGYGWYGAKPENENVGGGGGGAAAAVADGAGKADGTGGAGRASDITGETVVYAAGGRGGDRTDASYSPADGATPGSGGDGAGLPGPAGAGADGIVVVRLVDFFDMVKVPFPAYTDTFNWADGETLTAFDLSNFPESYQAAVASIEGSTNVSCYVEGGVTNGLGRQSFTITLKDGYVWDDGTEFGFDAPKTFFWRVREENVVGNAMAEVTKTVEWSDKTNAVIAITAHTTPEIRRREPKVLFLGSLCDAHEFSPTILAAALNAVTEVGSVDYYLFNAVQDKSDAAPAYQGSLPKGGIFDPSSIAMKTSNHSSLYGFYDTLAQLIDEGKSYDYVIFSFDRSLTATYFPGTHDHERQVVDFLKPLYEQNRVIWLVDNQSSGPTSPAISQTPWYPNQLVYVHFSGSNQTDYWGSLYDWESNWGNAKGGSTEDKIAASWQGLHALLGMFDPSSYETITRAIYDANYIADKNSITAAKVAATAGSINPNQVIYDSASAVAETIRSIVKPLDYTISLNDNIYLASGLKLNQVYGCWTTNQADIANTVGDYVNEVPAGWYPLTAGENLFPTDAGVSIKLPTISTEAWIRLWLDVSDTGRFLSSIDATYNTQTGLWQKDPNNGPVVVATTPDGGQEIIAEDQAATDVQWSFKAFVLTGTVESNTNGLYTGDILVNGYSTNWVAVGENSSPQSVFRGAPGYIIDRLVVDGEDVDFSIVTSDWIFEHVNADHDVKVWYKPYIVDKPLPVTGPVTNLYDGTAYAPTVTNVNFNEDIPYEWFPVYSFESNGVYSATNGQVNVVWGEDGTPQPTNVYVRIAVKQPGYEEPVILDNWTGVNEVVILPREVTVQFDNYVQTNDVRKTADFSWNLVEGEIVEGDTLSVTDSKCTDYPAKGGHTEDTITSDNVKVFDSEGEVSDNYIVHVIPGDYYYPDQSIVAEAEGVEKVYDGKPETIDVTAAVSKLPTAAEIRSLHNGSSRNNYNYVEEPQTSGIVIKYSNDGGKTFTLTEPPTFTDVGTNTVYYQVTYQYTYRHRRNNYGSWTTETVKYETIIGSADVIIHPRPVTVTADSAEKSYDGTPLTDGGYTVAPPTDVTGFVEGEGATFAMTDGSTITTPGTQPNVIDPSKTQAQSGTKLSNYEFIYEPGTLKVTGEIGAEPVSVEKIYDGQSSNIGVVVTDYKGDPLDPSEYTIKYSQYPNVPDSWTTDNPTFTNVGVSNVVYYVVEKDGYPPVEGKAYVTIWPREIVVTADDKSKYVGEEDPELTWTVTSGTRDDLTEEEVGILPGEEDLVESLVKNDPKHNIEREPGEEITPPGEPGYPITPSGSEYLGNYHVTYVDGELTIKDELIVTDEDAVKIYDGVPTNITVTVTTRTSEEPLDPEKDYTITYFCDPSDPDNLPDGPDGWSDTVAYTNATKGTPDLYPGTNKVWYVVEAEGFDAVTNYAYVVIDPRPVVIIADSAEKGYDGTPLTTNGFTVAESTETTGFVEGEGIKSVTMTDDSTITDPGTATNRIDHTTEGSVVPLDGTDLDNYVITYIDGTLKVRHIPETLIAEFTLASDNRSLQTMRIWAYGYKDGDIIYIAGASTFADARAGKWTPLVNSSNLVDKLPWKDENGKDITSDETGNHITVYKDIVFTDEEAKQDYRFFRPYVLSSEGDVVPGRKYVGIVDVDVDNYGETAVGVPFVRCLSLTPVELKAFETLKPWQPDIPVTELVQTNTLHGSDNGMVADKFYVLPEGALDVVNWFYLEADGNWKGVPDAATGKMPANAAVSSTFKRGTGFALKREEKFVTDHSIIRIHGQVEDSPVEWPKAQRGYAIMLSNGIPDDLDLNDKVYGVSGSATNDVTITYMNSSDYTYVLSYGDYTSPEAGTGWYYKKAAMVNGRRTQAKVRAAPEAIVLKGRVFWIKDNTSPATPVVDTYGK